MWGTVLVLALVAATDPVRLGIAVLLISRPRPMLNLLAFWFGGMAMGIAAALGVLILLRDSAPMFMQNVASTAASSTIGQIRIAMGVLALLTAVLVAVGFSARQRARAPMPSGDPSALALQPSTLTAFSRLSARAQDTLDSGSLGVAFLAGIGMATPPALYLAALVAIIASGGGTIVATARIHISSCAVSHGNVTISIASGQDVSQPAPFSQGGTTQVTTQTDVKVKEDKGSLVPLPELPTVEKVASALNALGVTPRDMMSMFEAMKEAGALQAELIMR